jgi:hypothetical protein
MTLKNTTATSCLLLPFILTTTPSSHLPNVLLSKTSQVCTHPWNDQQLIVLWHSLSLDQINHY